jgi:hypothetical protein
MKRRAIRFETPKAGIAIDTCSLQAVPEMVADLLYEPVHPVMNGARFDFARGKSHGPNGHDNDVFHPFNYYWTNHPFAYWTLQTRLSRRLKQQVRVRYVASMLRAGAPQNKRLHDHSQPTREPSAMECGGKRSATPLWANPHLQPPPSPRVVPKRRRRSRSRSAGALQRPPPRIELRVLLTAAARQFLHGTAEEGNSTSIQTRVLLMKIGGVLVGLGDG